MPFGDTFLLIGYTGEMMSEAEIFGILVGGGLVVLVSLLVWIIRAGMNS